MGPRALGKENYFVRWLKPTAMDFNWIKIYNFRHSKPERLSYLSIGHRLMLNK